MSFLRQSAVLLLSSCSAPILSVPQPPDGAHTVAIGISNENGSSVAVYSVESDWALSKEALEIVLAYYVPTLEELGAGEGPFLGSDSCGWVHPIETYSSDGQKLELLPADPPSWFLDALSPRRKLKCECVKFEATTVPFGDFTRELDGFRSRARSVAPLESGAALVGCNWGQVIVQRDASYGVDGCVDSPVTSISSLGSNRFLLGTESGFAVSGKVEEATRICVSESSTFVGTGTVSARVQWLSGSDPSEPYEVFTLTGTGALGRLTEAGFEPLAQLALSEEDAEKLRNHTGSGTANGGLVRLGPGRAVAAIGTDELLWWVDGQRPRVEKVEITRNAEIAAVGLAGALPTNPSEFAPILLGTADGRIVRYDASGNWLGVRGQQGFDDQVGAFIPYHDGFVVTSAYGQLVQYREGEGFCPSLIVADPGDARGAHAFQQGDGFFVADFRVGHPGVAAEGTWIEPTEK